VDQDSLGDGKLISGKGGRGTGGRIKSAEGSHQLARKGVFCGRPFVLAGFRKTKRKEAKTDKTKARGAHKRHSGPNVGKPRTWAGTTRTGETPRIRITG